MEKVIIVGGYGPGISAAVAEKFGKQGFTVALIGRNAQRLETGVKELGEKGIRAAAFPADLGDPVSVTALIGKVREQLGPITILQWTAYSANVGDLLTADAAAIRQELDVATAGLLTAVQCVLPDLRKQKEAAILVTNGGLLFDDPAVNEIAVQRGSMGLAVANAAKHKIVGLLAQKLKPENIYVGEVIVTGTVKGTAFDKGSATLEPSAIAEKFWDMYSARKDVSAKI